MVPSVYLGLFCSVLAMYTYDIDFQQNQIANLDNLEKIEVFFGADIGQEYLSDKLEGRSLVLQPKLTIDPGFDVLKFSLRIYNKDFLNYILNDKADDIYISSFIDCKNEFIAPFENITHYNIEHDTAFAKIPLTYFHCTKYIVKLTLYECSYPFIKPPR